MLKIIVTYAVEAERIELRWEDVEIHYVCTGVGKTKSAYRLTKAIDEIHPNIVINIGTVGTVNHQVGDIFVCRHFVDRDMHKVWDAGLKLDWNIDTSKLLQHRGYCQHWTESGVCNTGDSFLTELTHVEGDVVDMESYAQALVCAEENMPFIAVKYVTDIIGQNSVKHWEEKLTDSRVALSHFLNEVKQGI